MMVASQWKMSSSALGPALHDVGGSFCRSCVDGGSPGAFGVNHEVDEGVARVDADARAAGPTKLEPRRSTALAESVRWHPALSLPGKKPYVDAAERRAEVARGVRRARKRTWSSLVMRFEAILRVRPVVARRKSFCRLPRTAENLVEARFDGRRGGTCGLHRKCANSDCLDTRNSKICDIYGIIK